MRGQVQQLTTRHEASKKELAASETVSQGNADRSGRTVGRGVCLKRTPPRVGAVEELLLVPPFVRSPIMTITRDAHERACAGEGSHAYLYFPFIVPSKRFP